MIYRHKPKNKVEAFRYGFEELPVWIMKDDRVRFVACRDTEYLEISTCYGLLRANQGDYIVLGEGGEYYPCDHDVFHDNYEPIKDDEL